MTSIPFCVERPGPWVEPTDEQRERQREASELAETLNEQFGGDRRWATGYYNPSLDQVVVRLDENDAELELAIEEVAGEPIRFLFGDATIAGEQQAAMELLDGLVLGRPGSDVDGYGPSWDGLVHIDLRDLEGAEHFATTWGIPEPFDIFCITPEAVVSRPAGT